MARQAVGAEPEREVQVVRDEQRIGAGAVAVACQRHALAAAGAHEAVDLARPHQGQVGVDDQQRTGTVVEQPVGGGAQRRIQALAGVGQGEDAGGDPLGFAADDGDAIDLLRRGQGRHHGLEHPLHQRGAGGFIEQASQPRLAEAARLERNHGPAAHGRTPGDPDAAARVTRCEAGAVSWAARGSRCRFCMVWVLSLAKLKHLRYDDGYSL